MYSDPVSRHMLDAPHPHTRDHSSNALALAQGRSAKERIAHVLNSMHAITILVSHGSGAVPFHGRR